MQMADEEELFPDEEPVGVQLRREMRAQGLGVLIQTIVYFGIGVLYFKFCSELAWPALTSVYFITCTVTTVGYGETVVTSQLDKLFVICYGTFGLVFVFSSISEMLGAVLRAAERASQERRAVESTREAAIARECWWFLAILCMMASGAFTVCLVEGLDFVDGLYWAFQTVTTIGYGDIVIEKRTMKVFVVIYALFASVGLTYALARMVDAASDVAELRKRESLLHAELDAALVRRLDRDGRGLDRAEFVVGMLRILGHVTDDDAAPWFDRFDELDRDNDGKLGAEDLAFFDDRTSLRSAATARERRRSFSVTIGNGILSAAGCVRGDGTPARPFVRRPTVTFDDRLTSPLVDDGRQATQQEEGHGPDVSQ